MLFSDVKLRWLVFTVLFGMVPIFMRLLVSSFVEGEPQVAMFSAPDFISFGIVLQVSIFNEIRYHDLRDIEWKHRMLGVSSLFMLGYAVLYVIVLFSEVVKQININTLLYASVSCSAVSLLLCYMFYDRMTAADLSPSGSD